MRSGTACAIPLSLEQPKGLNAHVVGLNELQKQTVQIALALLQG
jgi:hypothetical protein